MAKVIATTSFDTRFDAQGIFSSDMSEFWVTTGLFPQEITIDLGATKSLQSLKLTTSGAKKVEVLGCENTTMAEFKSLGEVSPDENGGAPNANTVSLVGGSSTRLVKLVIKEGWGDFAAVHNVGV